MQTPQFPFSALQGQAPLKTALLLLAVDPMIGGLLIEGPRGTAKSTSARALADLLPSGDLVTLPLGAGEEQLIGSLDLQSALSDGEVHFQPGLLSRAHGGILYVDEVNLLADHLVDVLLDVAASGVNHVERDGVSHSHASHFVLIGTMNPEEGALRPQLLDRFGLFLRLPKHTSDPALRQRIVRQRLAFDENPQQFIEQYAEAQQALRQSVLDARARISTLEWSDDIHSLVSELCCEAAVEGLRADLTLLRAARAHAALQQNATITENDVHAVSEWVLTHRRNNDPSETPSTSPAPEPSDSNSGNHTPAPNSSPASNNEWGEMPPVDAPIQALKQVRPLEVKKSQGDWTATARSPR